MGIGAIIGSPVNSGIDICAGMGLDKSKAGGLRSLMDSNKGIDVGTGSHLDLGINLDVDLGLDIYSNLVSWSPVDPDMDLDVELELDVDLNSGSPTTWTRT